MLVRERGDDVRTIVGRAVIDHDDFVRPNGLRKDAAQRRFDIAGAVEQGNDRRNLHGAPQRSGNCAVAMSTDRKNQSIIWPSGTRSIHSVGPTMIAAVSTAILCDD